MILTYKNNASQLREMNVTIEISVEKRSESTTLVLAYFFVLSSVTTISWDLLKGPFEPSLAVSPNYWKLRSGKIYAAYGRQNPTLAIPTILRS